MFIAHFPLKHQYFKGKRDGLRDKYFAAIYFRWFSKIRGDAYERHLFFDLPQTYCNIRNSEYNKVIENEAFLIESER